MKQSNAYRTLASNARRAAPIVSVIVFAFLAGPAAAQAAPVSSPSQSAGLKVAGLFSDNMVLQRECDLLVWGWDAPGGAVAVTLHPAGAADKPLAKAEGKAGADGRWEVKLPPQKAGDGLEMTIAGSATLTVRNVAVGEVWLCSGQSNMAMPINWGVFGDPAGPEFKKHIEESNLPNFRMFKVPGRMAGEPAKDLAGEWQVCQPRYDKIMLWSAAGYFFGKMLHKELGVPVGIINSSVGGTIIEQWMGRATMLEVDPALKRNEAAWDRDAQKMAAYYKESAQFEAANPTAIPEWDKLRKKMDAEWKAEIAKAKAAGQGPPPQPRIPPKPGPVQPNVLRWPGSLYGGMIHPLAPFAIRGFVWYQGESNCGSAVEESYRKKLEALIKLWRADWKGERPFLVVQLPNFSGASYSSPKSKKVQADPVEEEPFLPPVREAQRRAAADLPNTGLVVSIDIGDPTNIHPPKKKEMGERIAALAMNTVYGRKDVVGSGPLFVDCEFGNGKAVVKFTSVVGGLAAKEGGEIKGFAIAGADGKFVWAKAAIEGSTVVLTSDEVKEPKAVRYSWAENPIGNLVNREGLPASPFKTDGPK